MYSKIILIGFGGVGKAFLVELKRLEPELFNLPFVIVDKLPIEEPYERLLPENFIFVNIQITQSNIRKFFEIHSEKDALIVDVAYRISTLEMLKLCDEFDCFYINTALDVFEEDKSKRTIDSIVKNSLIELKDNIVEEFNKTRNYTRRVVTDKTRSVAKSEEQSDDTTKTMILNQGMNPGLVSQYVLYALKRLAPDLNDYSEMVEKIGVNVIHISERDTQREKDLYLTKSSFNKVLKNTWSVPGFIDEGKDSAQISWGSHEEKVPKGILYKDQYMSWCDGWHMKCVSYEPEEGDLTGVVIPHAECYSLARKLNTNKRKITCHYVYSVSDSGLRTINEVDGLFGLSSDFDINFINYHILESREILDGYDSVGALIFTESGKKYWTGSILHNSEAHDPLINITCAQVAISIIAAIKWILNNRECGICEPEDLDVEFIIEYVKNEMGSSHHFPDIKPILLDVTDSTNISDKFYDNLVAPRREMIFQD